MTDLNLVSLCERLCENKNTSIVFHARPDGDAVGSAFALKLIFDALGISSYCICADPVPRRLAFITDGIQDSVSYDSIPVTFNVERTLSVDCGSIKQTGALAERVTPEISIDHHSSCEKFADTYLDSTAAATGEIIFDIAKQLIASGRLDESKLDRRFYSCVYAAISSDTGSFRYSNATPKTHRCAAELIEKGIDAPDINRRLFEIKTASSLRAMSLAIENMHVYCDGRISIVALDKDQIDKADILPEDCDMFIEAARSVEGSEIAISIRKTSDSEDFRASMRSSGKADVSAVCRAFGGGGHVRAAGCNIAAKDINEALLLALKEAERQLV